MCIKVYYLNNYDLTKNDQLFCEKKYYPKSERLKNQF